MRSPSSFSTSVGNTVYKELAGRLKERIDAGEFADGRLPSEREIALAYGVSRVSVRSALMMLRSFGLVSIENKARARLASPNSEDLMQQLSAAAHNLMSTREGVADFQEARALFEGAIARYAARHATPKEIERLGLALAENEHDIDDPEAFIQSDMDFHLVLAEVPRNPLLVALNNALSEWLRNQRSTSMEVRGSIRLAYEDHKRIYYAIASHDPEAADRAMADHLARVAQLYWKASVAAASLDADAVPARRKRTAKKSG